MVNLDEAIKSHQLQMYQRWILKESGRAKCPIEMAQGAGSMGATRFVR
jgi:hypothetical protein